MTKQNMASGRVGLNINFTKTQLMTNLVMSGGIYVDDEHIEQVSYMCMKIVAVMTNEINRRIALLWAVFG